MTTFFRRMSLTRLLNGLPATWMRIFRFACVGGTAALIQLSLLHICTQHGWNAIVAEATAFLLAAQVNFLLNITFTWRDRYGNARVRLLHRWLRFHCSIAGTALLNLAVFTIAHTAMPALLASALGIAVAAAANFVTFDRFVFRPLPVPSGEVSA